LSWLFIVALGIIWAAFLLPFGARRASPASTVEEFERKMDLLAETNRSPSGRWVLVPRKGERFMGPRDRKRMRIRRRRRVVFNVLAEATALTLLIGLFPPLRPMLEVTAVLGGILLVYVGLLLHIRALEIREGRALRARRLETARYERLRIEALQRAAFLAGNGNGNGHSANGRAVKGNGHTNGHSGNGHHDEAGNANGHRRAPAHAVTDEDDAELMDAGVRIIEDDVHVVIRRTSEAGRSVAH
jgi:hypothetical protein